jgi:GNAT superfamily N-acetyltransferase
MGSPAGDFGDCLGFSARRIAPRHRVGVISISPVRILYVDRTLAGMEILEQFYSEVYWTEFPDRNERESLINMRAYVEKRAFGWFGLNNYHILIAVAGEKPIGGVVADYLVAPNSGVIELLAVTPGARGQGLGGRLHAHAVDLLEKDAHRANGRQLEYVFAEIKHPLKLNPSLGEARTLAPVAMWAGWGYRLLDFPYAQPPLSPELAPVGTLSLISKTIHSVPTDAIPARTVQIFLRDYMVWAMRIRNPEDNAEFRSMNRYLAKQESISLLRLAD